MTKLRTCPGFLFAVWLAACSGSPEPVVVPESLHQDERIAVILVPGVTGVELRDRRSGRLVWGSGRALFLPRDGGYSIALPLTRNRTGVLDAEPGDVVDEIRVGGLLKKPVYGPIADLFISNGYQRGDLRNPVTGDDFFLFAYDWRLDNTLAAALLAQQIESLGRARSDPRLSVVLLCQSNGAHICRYLAKYGGASLEQAEAGDAGSPERFEIRKIILIGTANGGGIRILRELDRGRRYVSLVGRKLRPETLFSLESLYQDLPSEIDGLFVDESGETVEVDLYDPEAWVKYGWSVWSRKAGNRLARSKHSEIFGDEVERKSFLAEALDRARRFQRLLAAEVPELGPTRYYMLQNLQKQTPAGAVLVREGEEWATYFAGDRWLVKRPELLAKVSSLGDGHATRESQMQLSQQELERLVLDPVHIDGGHFEMILEPELHRHLLEFVLDDSVRSVRQCEAIPGTC